MILNTLHKILFKLDPHPTLHFTQKHLDPDVIGSYNPTFHRITLYLDNIDDKDSLHALTQDIIGTILHEHIHFLLHRDHNLQTCIAFDNIAHWNTKLQFNKHLYLHHSL